MIETRAETLLQVFDPPEGLLGRAAVLVAMTADEDVLNEAMERFTLLHDKRRAELGVMSGFVMLDAHCTEGRTGVLPSGRVPGLYEFHPRPTATSLLHAKLVLSSFAKTRTGTPTHLRLSVLTGNFTYASSRQYLELVWVIDLPLDEVPSPEDCADIRAAGAFVKELLARRYHANPQRLITARLDELLQYVERLPQPKRSTRLPRFIHSLEAPLFPQIEKRFSDLTTSRKNFLLCGSGFFEQPEKKQAGKPQILSRLEKMEIWTAKPDRVVIVEPRQSGAVGAWARKLAKDTKALGGWQVSRPSDTGYERILHAKYIFAANKREAYDSFSNGILYLGSGNLSKQGMFTHGQEADGNVECGVVCEMPEPLDSEDLVSRLFWDPEANEIDENEWQDRHDTEDMIYGSPLLEAPPILSALLQPDGLTATLSWRDDLSRQAEVHIRVAGDDWAPIPTHAATCSLPHNAADYGTLAVRSGDREWAVPIVDPSGRVAWQPARYESYEDALDMLLAFPMTNAAGDDVPGEGEDNTDEGAGGADDDENDGHPHPTPVPRLDAPKTYALYAAAQLVERVAALQRVLPEELVDDWLEHLDRNLAASFPQDVIERWSKHRVEIFFHLIEKEFRPAKMSDAQLKRYKGILRAVSDKWGTR